MSRSDYAIGQDQPRRTHQMTPEEEAFWDANEARAARSLARLNARQADTPPLLSKSHPPKDNEEEGLHSRTEADAP